MDSNIAGVRREASLQGFLLVVTTLVFAQAGLAQAQTSYPNRPIELVVTVPPGGAADFVGRLIGAKLADAVGQPVVISNRGGAGGTIAAAAVARADPDGYTLLLNTIATHGIGPHIYANLQYDPAKDFSPVVLIAKFPLIMAVNADVPVRSVADVITLAKARPGELSYCSAGVGGAPHLAGELFKSLTETELLHVPYRGSGPAVADLVAGRITMMFDAIPSLLPFINAGKLRALAAASPQRNRLLPDVPSFAELGYPAMDIALWYGVAAPSGTPAPIVQRLNVELVKILDSPSIRKSLTEQGADIQGGTPEEFGAFIGHELARWGAIVKQAGIKPQP
jgi:tripartite-type tricarboxylate transporter receptor subunit TctC